MKEPAQSRATGLGSEVAKATELVMKHGLHERFTEALAKKKFAKDDVEAGRAYVKAYISYIHYVEGMRQAASGAAHGHPGEDGEA
jgi:hypothetical protein